ncbi:MAG: DUF4838 domain-containing protein [Planctomycetota bacterium]|nr:DUF4838 domain-containing protein [Planctomycetota bacterium]
MRDQTRSPLAACRWLCCALAVLMAAGAARAQTAPGSKPAGDPPGDKEARPRAVLYDAGTTRKVEPMPIYAGPDAGAKAVAAQLANYLKAMTGAEFKAQPAFDPAAKATTQPTTATALPARGLFVGVDPLLAKSLEPDAFRIRVVGQRVDIAGGSAQGLLYGVYAMLEQLGCRWWSQNEEDVPKTAVIALPEGDRIVRPVFAVHDIWNREAQSNKGNFAAKLRSTSEETIVGGHSLYPLLTPYAEKHGEIYPMDKDGQRKANKLHFCYLAPGIVDALVDAIDKEVVAHNGQVKGVIYFAGMGDWYGGMCLCDDCKKVYEEETWTDPEGRKKAGYTATLLRMINAAAEKLEKNHPGIRVGTFAYMSLEAPPAKTRPRENVVIRVPRLRHCTVHPADTCEKNASFARNLERWCEIAPGRTYVWEYGASFKNFVYPFPCLNSMTQNLRYYARLGVHGVQIQGNYSSMGGDLAALKNYVWSKVFADPKVDAGAVLTSFCQGYYGPAAAEMQKYVEVLEKSVVEPTAVHADEFADPGYLSAQVRQDLAQWRDAALVKAGENATFARRVRESTVGVEALKLWHAGPLEERDGRLIRTDIGSDTLSRAETMLADLRDASPTEFSSGRAARMSLLPLHGGPVVKLARGPLAVKVAPVLNGQIRQITFMGKDLLHLEANARAKGYPLLGGSLVNAGTRYLRLKGEPAATGPATDTAGDKAVEMFGDGGVGAWSSATKFIATQKLDLPENGTIRLIETIKPVVKSEDKHGGGITTVYAVGKKIAKLVVESQGQDDRWTKVALPAEKGEVELPGIRGLRITLPGQACVVSDQLGVWGNGGKITLDPAAGTLTTTLSILPVEGEIGKEVKLFERKLKVWPVEAETN